MMHFLLVSPCRKGIKAYSPAELPCNLPADRWSLTGHPSKDIDYLAVMHGNQEEFGQTLPHLLAQPRPKQRLLFIIRQVLLPFQLELNTQDYQGTDKLNKA